MAVSGKIKTFPLTDLFQWISLSRKSGVLRISCGDFLIQVFFRKGVLISATSTDPLRRFGQYLLARGFLTETALRRASPTRSNPRGNGCWATCSSSWASWTGGGSNARCGSGRRSSSTTCSCWKTACFSSRSGGHSDNLVAINLNIDSLILEGVRRKDEWERIRQVLPDDAARVRIVPGQRRPVKRRSCASRSSPCRAGLLHRRDRHAHPPVVVRCALNHSG